MSLKPKQPKGKYKPRENPNRNNTADEYLLDFTQRNAVSRKVLKEMKTLMKQIKHDTKRSPSGYITLEFFTNGRERGYTMTVGNKAVHWAESRGSDNIVVYQSKGAYDKFAYDNRVFFRNDEIHKAAKYMLDYLF